jgi:glycine/D-amino acid oxidase-like deaminating enzyme
MYDYIIVGFGIAGFSFAQQLEENKKNFVVFDNHSQQSTRIAGGMFNPIILKRFTPAWQAAEMLPYALLQFQKAELKYQQKFIHYIDIYRKLTSVQEQNNWLAASDRPVMRDFMQDISYKKIEGIETPFGFGVLKGTGIVNAAKVLDTALSDLKTQGKLLQEDFDYDALQIFDTHVVYKDIKAQKIVFAEGFGMKKNPFFKDLPLQGTKGEMLMVETETTIPYIVKSAAFLAPNVENDKQFYVGATYNWEDKTNEPTDEARAHLEMKLQKLYNKKYKVVLQKAGIRPTVIDRRPLVGRHQKYKNLGILNGMGTRGVILAPTTAKQLFNYLTFDMPLPKEINIDRFDV